MQAQYLNRYNEQTGETEQFYPVTHTQAVVGLDTAFEQTAGQFQSIIDWCNNFSTYFTVELNASNWSSTYPHTQTISMADVKESNMLALVKTLNGTESEDYVKSYNRAFDLIFSGETGNGTLTFYATKIPTINFTVGLKGV